MTDPIKAISSAALDALRNGQRQLDMDGCEVGVSRQALDEALAGIDAALASPPSDRGRQPATPEHGLAPCCQPGGSCDTESLVLALEDAVVADAALQDCEAATGEEIHLAGEARLAARAAVINVISRGRQDGIEEAFRSGYEAARRDEDKPAYSIGLDPAGDAWDEHLAALALKPPEGAER